MYVSLGKRHSHDRLLPFGHSQKQIAGWASGLIMLVRGYLIVATQQNRAELFGFIIINIMDGLCPALDLSLMLILHPVLVEMWPKLHMWTKMLVTFCHLLLVFLYFPFHAQSFSTVALNVVLSLYCIVPVDEKRKSKSTPVILAEITKEEGLWVQFWALAFRRHVQVEHVDLVLSLISCFDFTDKARACTFLSFNNLWLWTILNVSTWSQIKQQGLLLICLGQSRDWFFLHPLVPSVCRCTEAGYLSSPACAAPTLSTSTPSTRWRSWQHLGGAGPGQAETCSWGLYQVCLRLCKKRKNENH